MPALSTGPAQFIHIHPVVMMRYLFRVSAPCTRSVDMPNELPTAPEELLG
jgi:hypothetical protein